MGTVSLLLLTYNRKDYAERTLRSALDKIKTTHDLSVHIADDGTGKEYQDYLRHIAGGYKHVKSVFTTDSERGGYGKNFNLAAQVIHTHARYVLCLEDDWELMKELDLDPLLSVLDTSPTIGCIRLGYVGFTQELRGHIETWASQYFLVFDPDSPEPHVFAGHPRVEAVVWEKECGPWVEGMLPGATEFHMAKCPAFRKRVAWPLSLVKPEGDLFAHIGTIRAY